MARKRIVRPTSTWRYGPKDNPLYILENNGGETDIRFIKDVTHDQFRVNIRGHWHTFYRNKLYAYKCQLFDEPWISSVAYWSLLAMAEHVMCAIFHSFQPNARPSRRALTVENHRVQLLKLARGLLVFKWNGDEYTVTEQETGCWFDADQDAEGLPVELRCFFEAFATWIWPKLPTYMTKEEVSRRRDERRIANAPPAPLFGPDGAPPVVPKKKRVPLPIPARRLEQPSLFNR